MEIVVIGIAMIIFGTVVALFGERTVQAKEKDGFIARLFSPPDWWARFIKWPIGLISIAMGVWILLHADQL